ncbi:MAG: hypothetical protein Q8J99_04680, partial [Sulfuritalea sp.]|nr:hypothetical protein [Sulfuritalea sp.]
SVTGALVSTTATGTLDYDSYASDVTYKLGGTAGSTGIGGTNTGFTTITGSGNNDTVTGTDQTYNLTALNGGNNGAVSWTSFENLTATGASTINGGGGSSLGGSISSAVTTLGGTIQTAGSQTYTGGVTLNAATTLTSTSSGAITFGSTVDGANNLTVGTNGSGAITFVGVVGGVTPIGNLTAVAGGAIAFGPMTLVGNLDAYTTGGSITQTGILSISGDLWVKSNAGAIDFYNSGMNSLGGTVSLIDASRSNEVKLSANSIKVGTTGPSNGSIVDADSGIQGARVTIKAPSGAAILADGTQGLITADAPFDTLVASLIIDTSAVNGAVGNPNTANVKTEGLRVNTSGLVVVIGQAAGDGTIMLVGDDAVQPKYKESGDPNFRPVMYNGVQATNAQLAGALDAVYLDIRNLTTEIRESGFAKENASKVLRRGVVTSAGPGQPAVDDSSGTAGLELCDGRFGGNALTCQ